MDYLTSILARLASRQFPHAYNYEGDVLRVVAIVPSFESLLAEAFEQIRSSAEVSVAILARMLGALDTLGSLIVRRSHIQAIYEQVQWIAEVSNRCIEAAHDR